VRKRLGIVEIRIRLHRFYLSLCGVGCKLGVLHLPIAQQVTDICIFDLPNVLGFNIELDGVMDTEANTRWLGQWRFICYYDNANWVLAKWILTVQQRRSVTVRIGNSVLIWFDAALLRCLVAIREYGTGMVDHIVWVGAHGHSPGIAESPTSSGPNDYESLNLCVNLFLITKV
jgi:hypothetical protein